MNRLTFIDNLASKFMENGVSDNDVLICDHFETYETHDDYSKRLMDLEDKVAYTEYETLTNFLDKKFNSVVKISFTEDTGDNFFYIHILIIKDHNEFKEELKEAERKFPYMNNVNDYTNLI